MCSPCIADEELFTARDTEPAPPRTIVAAMVGSYLQRRGDAFGERGYVECRECMELVVAGDSEVYAPHGGGAEFHICMWCSGRAPEEEEIEHMATLVEFHATIRHLCKMAGKSYFAAEVHATEWIRDGERIELKWRGYIDGFGYVEGCTAESVVETMRKRIRGDEVDLGTVGTPPEPRAA